MKRETVMKKALYFGLVILEGISLFVPLFFILYLNEFLVSAIAFLVIAAVYAFLGIRAFKQKKAGDESGIKKTRIFAALVSPVVWVLFIIYFLYICEALGVV